MCLYVYNRSLLLTNQNDPKKRLCATILTPYVELAEAQFTDPAGRISGKIVIMSNEYSGDLQVSSDYGLLLSNLLDSLLNPMYRCSSQQP